MGTNQLLMDQIRLLSADTTVKVAVQNSGVFACLSHEQAIKLLQNTGPAWYITIRQDEEALDVWLVVDEGEGVGSYYNPPPEE